MSGRNRASLRVWAVSLLTPLHGTWRQQAGRPQKILLKTRPPLDFRLETLSLSNGEAAFHP